MAARISLDLSEATLGDLETLVARALDLGADRTTQLTVDAGAVSVPVTIR